ncbi:hypothetical protein BRADI_1g14567v3 [Brachypodium distachyon]|uniref:Uncharacterized protein n=1 Tax=Brachypodium distachyon TaxID=15368 RepID=A0A2K2DJH0_BRADI|nr:hypothetical protein BRADI_1g14567v3 [Brachypodium distachyon]
MNLGPLPSSSHGLLLLRVLDGTNLQPSLAAHFSYLAIPRDAATLDAD